MFFLFCVLNAASTRHCGHASMALCHAALGYLNFPGVSEVQEYKYCSAMSIFLSVQYLSKANLAYPPS